MPEKMLPVGLALSGGTAKAIAHVGVIKALTEAGIPIDRVAATSGGSMVAALYTSGMPASTMLEVANNLKWGKLVAIRFSRLGIVSSQRIEDFVKEIIGDITFDDLKIPCSIVVTRLEDGKKKVFETGKVARAVRASCSIPQIFLPVEIDGDYYVDGGFSEYLPVETVLDHGQMFCIASHLAHVKGPYRRPKNYLQLAIHVTGLVARTNYVTSVELADVLIHPKMDTFGSFDFENSEDLIDAGYQTTKALIPEIKRKWKRKSSRINRFLRRIMPEA